MVTVRAGKPNFVVYSSLSRLSTFDRVSKPVNISELIKKNKEEAKREKKRDVYTIAIFTGLILTIGIFFYI
tara:strand:+ start:266 stop:478 length:213 start_codon:yes stop_codon:yes gene_type:complete